MEKLVLENISRNHQTRYLPLSYNFPAKIDIGWLATISVWSIKQRLMEKMK